MNLDLVRSVADAATVADGADPLDEGTWLSLRASGSGDDGWGGVVTDQGFALTHGEDLHLVVHPA
ncbi:MAG: mycothiol synthase, partial [Nocardioides sp.]